MAFFSSPSRASSEARATYMRESLVTPRVQRTVVGDLGDVRFIMLHLLHFARTI